MPTQSENKAMVAEAARVDFVKLLEGDLQQVVVLRRIQTLAGALIDFMNAVGTLYEREAYATLMRETAAETAPNIHDALMNRTFDGQDALRSAYTALVEKFAVVKGVAHELNNMHALTANGDAISRRNQLAAQVEAAFGETVSRALTAGTEEHAQLVESNGEAEDD